jgi:hypothetical protein
MPISLNLKNLVVFMGPKLNLTPQLDFFFFFFSYAQNMQNFVKLTLTYGKDHSV